MIPEPKTYKTSAEFGPFGECDVEVFGSFYEEIYDHRHGDVDSPARFVVDCARFYSNGRWVDMDREEALNLFIEEKAAEHFQEDLQEARAWSA